MIIDKLKVKFQGEIDNQQGYLDEEYVGVNGEDYDKGFIDGLKYGLSLLEKVTPQEIEEEKEIKIVETEVIKEVIKEIKIVEYIDRTKPIEKSIQYERLLSKFSDKKPRNTKLKKNIKNK